MYIEMDTTHLYTQKSHENTKLETKIYKWKIYKAKI